ncbi:hypothetical protein [Noviherbaspirillum sp.]|uniref:hypothetical protein n=1 Tax=Noviherbaspirillum sp. TaxID=1926288 RepID=UPI002FE13D5F
MHIRKHLGLLLQGVSVWGAFWLAGLPAYYQQYSNVALAIACILLSVAISLAAIVMLRSCREDKRMSRAFWLSFYYTVPFAALDALYCGWYLGHGARFLTMYWYLTIFYITPWLTFMPTAALLSRSTWQAAVAAGGRADPRVS